MFRKTIISPVLAALAAFPFSTLTAANVDAAANVAANAAVTNAVVANAVAANDDDDDMLRRWAVITGMNLSCPTTADRDHNAAHDERAATCRQRCATSCWEHAVIRCLTVAPYSLTPPL